MMEIELDSLRKNEKRIRVKSTAKRKGHYRKIKGAKEMGKEQKKSNLHEGINNLDLTTKNENEIKTLLINNGWNIYNSEFFGIKSSFKDINVHFDGNEIYAISKLSAGEKSVHLNLLEVNPDKQRQGHGINTMRDIISTIIDSEIYDKIELTSANSDSDKFYNIIGMRRSNSKEDYEAEYEGNKTWMKKFLKLTSKKQ